MPGSCDTPDLKSAREYSTIPIISVPPRYHSAGGAIPIIRVTAPTPPPFEDIAAEPKPILATQPGAVLATDQLGPILLAKVEPTLAREAEAIRPLESASTFILEVPPGEHMYREETGYKKKKKQSAVGLAVRRMSAKMELDKVAKNVGSAMTKPWSFGGGDGGDDRGKIELGKGLCDVKEGESDEGAGGRWGKRRK